LSLRVPVLLSVVDMQRLHYYIPADLAY